MVRALLVQVVAARILGRFPTEAPWVLVGPGEGAGVVDIGDGLAVAMRIESHNHPSAVEPYQGAATGVGGIIRDIFSMGARPIALDGPAALRPARRRRARATCSRASCRASAATATRSACRRSAARSCSTTCYRDNPLVNVLCLGILPKERLVLARAEGAGNLAVLLGSSTGRDGIGGASVLASAGFEEGAEAKRPSVQVGDPFEEKRLIEACLELLDAGLAVGVQDLGAAGLSCAASETAAKGGAGMDVDVARVSEARAGHERRSRCMTSESQERMLAIVDARRPRRGARARARRWEIRATVVGRVTDTGRFRVFDGLFDAIGVPGANPPPPRGDDRRRCRSDRAAASPTCPSGSLGDGPRTTRPARGPRRRTRCSAADPAPDAARQVPGRGRPRPASCSRCSRRRRSPTSRGCRASTTTSCSSTRSSGPAATPRCCALKGTPKALALSTDGKARFCRLDPRTGGRLVVLEAARNVACAGARRSRSSTASTSATPSTPR